MNKDVLAIHNLRGAIGSEWKHRASGVTTQIAAVDTLANVVAVVPVADLATDWKVLDFFKAFQPALKPEEIPTWYARLLADGLSVGPR